MAYKIMIVDDAIYMRTMLRRVLAEDEYDIVEAGNGQEAVDLYAQEQPDLVLMDITMPRMDGIAATGAIRAGNAAAKVVIVSGLGQQAMVIDAMSAGAMDYIAKPFEPQQIRDAVTRNLKGDESVV